MTSKNIDTSQSTFYFFLIILTITIVKQYTMGSGSDITWSLIYLFTTLISQYILNLYLRICAWNILSFPPDPETMQS